MSRNLNNSVEQSNPWNKRQVHPSCTSLFFLYWSLYLLIVLPDLLLKTSSDETSTLPEPINPSFNYTNY